MKFKCRLCEAPLSRIFVDLGSLPLANDYPDSADINLPVYPLQVFVCDQCFLTQTHHSVEPKTLFKHYSYFSSFSSTWLNHAREFAERMMKTLALNEKSCVIEVASNDGYLLRNFVAKNIPCLGIEPAANAAAAARAIGVPTDPSFFNKATASRLAANGKKADLLIANNVIAHVPDLNGFIESLAIVLKSEGVLSVEFPHLLQLIKINAFDTIYHEHYSYFSLLAFEKALKRHKLRVFAVEKQSTHGGSFRVLSCHNDSKRISIDSDLELIRKEEHEARLDSSEGYEGFASSVTKVKKDLCNFLAEEHAKGRRIAAYGAAAKGNTLLNVCGLDRNQISYVVDRNPTKQGHYLPGSKIPVFAPDKVFADKPDILLILPWNIEEEVREQMKEIREWGGKFVTAIPKLRVWN